MNCKQIKLRLSAYLDQELEDPLRNRIEEHLASCAGCRESLEELKHYLSVAAIMEPVKAPSWLEERILQRTEAEDYEPPIRSIFTKRRIVFRVAALVAAILVLAFAIVPARYYTPQKISSSLVFGVVKKGKGSGESRRSVSRVEDPRVLFIRDVADSLKGVVLEEIKDPETGVISSLTFRISKKRYPDLYQIMMQEGMKMNLPETLNRGLYPYVTIQLEFPIRYFFTGDYNGDGLSDIVLYRFPGASNGSWFVMWNEGNGVFSTPLPAFFPPVGKYHPGDTRFLSGDINGDGWDDLVVFNPGNPDSTVWTIFLNDTADNFYPIQTSFTGSWAISRYDSVIPLVGDFTGDHLDDIGIHVIRGPDAGRWIISFNLGKNQFGLPAFLPIEMWKASSREGYFPLVMDYNGDGWDDALHYWQKGSRAAAWIVAVNRKNGTFYPGFRVLYAFMGNYIPFPGDFNGDGYADILVKQGSMDEVGEWILMVNRGGRSFECSNQVTFGNNSVFVTE